MKTLNIKTLNKKVITAVAVGCTSLIISGFALADNITTDKIWGNSSENGSYHQMMKGENGANSAMMSDRIQQFVKDGTITSEQGDKLKKAMEKRHEERKQEWEKVNKMSQSEKDAYFANKKGEGPGEHQQMFLSDLSKDTGIAKDTLTKILPVGGPNHKGMMGPGDHRHMSVVDCQQQLTKLVQTGTVTQTEADQINSYLTNKNQVHQAEKQKIEAMSDSERQAYFSEQRKAHEIKRLKGMAQATGISAERLQVIMTQVQPQPEQQPEK